MARARIVVLAGALSMLAASCTGLATSTTTPPPPPPPTQTVPPTSSTTTTTTAPPTSESDQPGLGPRRGGRAVIGIGTEAETLNPYVPAGDDAVVAMIGNAVWAGVFEFDATTLEYVADAVVELPAVSNGGIVVNEDGTMTVRYQIRAEAVWDDLVPISGHDLAFTYETLAALDFTPMASIYPVADGIYQQIIPSSVVAGDKTFQFTMVSPTLQYRLLFPAILPAHVVAGTDFAADWNDVMWASGGPFKFDDYDRSTGTLTLARNRHYWKSDPATGARLPYLNGLEFRFYPEGEDLIEAIETGEIHAVDLPAVPATAAELAGHDDVQVQLENSVIWEHLNFQFGTLNPNGVSWNRYAGFRRAVAHAVDKQAIVDAGFWLAAEPLGSYLDVAAPQLSGTGWDRYAHDPARSRELIAELCAKLQRDCQAQPPVAVLTTTGNSDERPALAALLQPMLEEAGIVLDLNILDSILLFGSGFGTSVLETGAYDLGQWAWVGFPGMPGLLRMHGIFDPGGPPPDGINFYRWGTPAVIGESIDLDQGPSRVQDEHTARVAQLIDVLESTVDDQLFMDTVTEIEDILADQVVFIPLVARGSLGAHRVHELSGYDHNPGPGGDTWNVETWYRLDGS